MTSVLPPPNIQFFKEDISSSSNNSLYTSEAHNRITTGDFIYQPSNNTSKITHKKKSLSKLTDKELSEQPLSNLKSGSLSRKNSKKGKHKKEFTVVRKNSYHGPNYFRMSHGAQLVSPSARLKLKKIQEKRRINSKFENDTQIEPVFNLFPETSLLEKPSYMVQYFTKTFELIKKNPDIHYQILRAQIEVDTAAKKEESIKRMSIKRKYQSLPAMPRSDTIKNELSDLRKNHRKSAPSVTLSYRPTSMTITEYLNTPLDFYQHRKQNSKASSSDKSKETRITHNSTQTQNTQTSKAVSSGSNVDSVATSTLYASRSKLLAANIQSSSQKSVSLKTQKKDNILQRRSAPEASGLRREKSLLKREKYLSKYGTTLFDTNVGQTIVEEASSKKTKSDRGDLSIATGNELYNAVKTEIFAERFADWNSAIKYIIVNKPELSDNPYFLTRLMFEIYLRRIVAAKIAFKLGSDKANMGGGDEIWIGLKECIASVYGDDNADFFESQNKKPKE